MPSKIFLEWIDPKPGKHFRTGVSLHSHTLHSRESLDFIYRAGLHVPVLAAALRWGERRHQELNGVPLDLARGWWTPPLGPTEAFSVERTQIENLQLAPLVSLTDHDDIEAATRLQLLEQYRGAPISVEWTVPFRGTFFHFGIHNLPTPRAHSLFAEMLEYQRTPNESRLSAILSEVTAIPETLVVFNHPLWDEKGLGQSAHNAVMHEVIKRSGANIHALELNGMRSWRENRDVIALAESTGKPVISGGDRHAIEPNTLLNVTEAQCFAEFADQVRAGRSDVLILCHYREPYLSRMVHNTLDVLKTYETHAMGWRTWSDRVFYACFDGCVRSLTELFAHGLPAPVGLFIAGVRLASIPQIRRLMRGVLSRAGEVTI